MPEKSGSSDSSSRVTAALSVVSLRLAGEVGQRTLDRLAAGHPALNAGLDQHVAAVRAAIAEYPMDGERSAAAIARRAAIDARVGAAGCQGLGELLSAMARSCPDVPFVADAHSCKESVPLELLLHYMCGFLEEAVTRDWWPADDAEADPDWESTRIAAVLQLISQAEATAEENRDLPSQPLSLTCAARRCRRRLPPCAAVPGPSTALREGDGPAAGPAPSHRGSSCASGPRSASPRRTRRRRRTPAPAPGSAAAAG